MQKLEVALQRLCQRRRIHAWHMRRRIHAVDMQKLEVALQRLCQSKETYHL
jgi:hypothetical protein